MPLNYICQKYANTRNKKRKQLTTLGNILVFFLYHVFII